MILAYTNFIIISTEPINVYPNLIIISPNPIIIPAILIIFLQNLIINFDEQAFYNALM